MRRTFVGLKFEWVWGIIGSDVRGGGADCEILYDVRCAACNDRLSVHALLLGRDTLLPPFR